MDKRIEIAAFAVVLAVMIIAVLVYNPGIVSKTSVNSVSTTVPIAMTDPAEVPANTTSLYIDYSSFSVFYFSRNGTAGTVNVDAAGSINLLSLVNVTKVLAAASLPINSTAKSIQFTVVSSNITINGTVYSVKVPSPIITAAVSQGFSKISNSSDLVLDFTPAVVSVYTANSTEYMLIPSLLVVSSNGLVNRAVGAVERIPSEVNRSLFSARPNITITGAVLRQSGNVTTIQVTVKDNSNKSVLLQHLRLKMSNGFGLSTFNNSINLFNNTKNLGRKYAEGLQSAVEKIKSDMPSIMNNLNASISSNLGGINTSLGGIIPNRGNLGNIFKNIQSRVRSQFTEIQQQIQQNLAANQHRVDMINRLITEMSINFFISSNGTLFLPFSGKSLFNMPINISSAKVNRINSTDMNVSYNGSGYYNRVANNSSFNVPANFGYQLPAGGSVTLSFNSSINLADGLVSLQLVPGVNYNLYLQGNYGVSAVYSANATS